MKVGDLVKGRYAKKNQYGIVIKVVTHKHIYEAVRVSWDCGSVRWFMMENLEVI